MKSVAMINRKPAYFVRVACLGLGFLFFCSSSHAQFSESDRHALEALYHATGGDNWTNNSNWLTANINEWYGVEAYESGERRVYAIELSDNNLVGEIPQELSKIRSLRTLVLSNNLLIGVIPEEIGLLRYLRELDLSRNFLTGEIPLELGSTALRSLDLGNNLFTGNIPYTFSGLRLKAINVQDNRGLTGTLPFGLKHIFRPEKFWFDGTNLCESSYSGFQSWINEVADLRRSGCIAESDEPLTGNCNTPTGEAYLDANNVRARVVNTGGLFFRGEPHVYEVPRSSGTNAIFAGNLWIAGVVDGSLRASATRYGDWELWAGPLDEDGQPPTNCDDYDYVYSVRKTDIEEYESTGVATYDLQAWPTGLGAPTRDANGNEIDLLSQPLSSRLDRKINLASGERPAIIGDQSIWWVMNDRGNEHRSSDTPPIGLEVHGHAFAASSWVDGINDATLYSVRIINRNTFPMTDAYIAVFLDPDLGNAGDDHMGSDSLLGMGFVYNADNFDDGDYGYGTPPPAVGVLFLDGPTAENDSIDNDSDGQIDEPDERLSTSTVGMWTRGGGGSQSAPVVFGLHYYYSMQGKWRSGRPFTVGWSGYEVSDIPTHYFFPGDPVTGAFWSEVNIDGLGNTLGGGDRSLFIASGPFELEPGEETDITFAVVWARGRDYLDSITELRRAADQIRIAFESDFLNNPRSYPVHESSAEPNPVAALAHNYPEPFADLTTIKYRVPHLAQVQLVVFDVLGREVETLVSEPQDAGEYSVTFDGRDLPSGVYFYEIRMDQASGTGTMLLLN